jgi:hypothetical protein
MFKDMISLYCGNDTKYIHLIRAVGKMQSFFMLKQAVGIVTTGLQVVE